MKSIKYLSYEEGFYRFLTIVAFLATLGFGWFYYRASIPEVYIPTFIAFGLYVIYGALSLFSVSLVVLFRLSILTALAAFCNQIYFTGGVFSSALPELIIPPLLAFFYKPIYDRYLFMIMSGICMIAIYSLSSFGHTSNLLIEDLHYVHSIICSSFVFIIISIYTFLFRNTLVAKNRRMVESMEQLQETTHKLIQSEKMASLGMLSAGVAHEINNPLNFIKGGIEVLEEGLEEEKDLQFEAEPCIHVVKEGLTRATDIVKSLSQFSRTTESMSEKCDINKVLNNTLTMLQGKLKYKGKVHLELTEEPLIIIGNEGKLHQAFLNIISNAEQAIARNGNIFIRSTKKPQSIVVEIEDDGEGISEENLKKISDPFFTTKPVGKGTGLGLSITYQIIEEHNGSINVSSKLGKGSKFTLTFKAS